MKKLLCLLAALAVCCMLVTVVSAAQTATVPTTCAAGCEDPVWEPLPSSNTWSTLEEGHYHYYLTENSTVYCYTPNPKATVSDTNSGAKVTICLDLNGYNITSGKRALGVYTGNTLNIMDSSEDQTGYIQGNTGSNNSLGGTIFNYGTVNLYSGTLRYVYDGTGSAPTYGGGVMSMGGGYPDATFNMYGGRLEGDDMVVSSGGNSYGGTIYAGDGKINFYGGEVISGSVPEGYNGPCVFISGNAEVTLSGNAKVDDIFINKSTAKVNVSGTYSGKARLTCGDDISLADGTVIGAASNTPNITGDLFCTNGNGWLLNISDSDLVLATYTPSAEWHECQHCKEVVRWTPLTTDNYATMKTEAGDYHHYLTGTLSFSSGSSYPQLCSGAKLCLDLYGETLKSTYGRAILVNGGATLNLLDTVGGGCVQSKSGANNVRGTTITVSAPGVMNMYGGTISYTDASNSKITARNGIVAVGGTLNMFGGKIQGADLSQYYDNTTGGAVTLYNATGTLNAYGGEITSGTVNSVGPCVYASNADSSVMLSGDAKVENIYFVANNQKLTISDTYTGSASLTYAEDAAVALGDAVGVSDNASITRQIPCTNGDWLVTVQDDQLVLSIDAPVGIVTDSGDQGYETLQDAIDAYETGCIRLLDPITENVTVGKNINLDLNGNTLTGTVTVEEGATLYGKDSQTDDYTIEDADGYGKLTVSGNVAAQDGYLMINESGAVSFHKLTVKIKGMSLRSESAGIYYNSDFLGDEKVASRIESFGVALSVRETPNADNIQTKCERSRFYEFEAGATGNASTSTLVKGILKEKNSDATNTNNLNRTIYGRPYIETAAGYIFGEPVERNLAEQLEDVDDIFAKLTGNQSNAWLTMYETYETVLGDLELTNTVQEKEMNDKTLKVLMVGNSFCYYYVQELYGLLMANPNRDYEAVEVYNLYYSGCLLSQHYNWWIAGNAKYELYKTDINGRKKQTPAEGTVWSLEDALQQGRWDYLSLQGASSEVSYMNGTVEDNGAHITKYADPLLDRFHELHPYAQLLWHRTWAFEENRIGSDGRVYSAEDLVKYDKGMQAACDYMCNEFDQDKPYDLKMVNSGAAWTIAREENAKLETSLIPEEGGLCARKGIRNEKTFPYFTGNKNAGDGYHDGDIGGGQFLNACAWYEVITGESCLDNSYKPTTENGTYELSDDFAALLRNAVNSALHP